MSLTNNIVIQRIANFLRCRDTFLGFIDRAFALFFDDVHAKFDTFIANENRWACYEFTNFMLALAAK